MNFTIAGVMIIFLIAYLITALTFRPRKKPLARCANCQQVFEFNDDCGRMLSHFKICPHCGQMTHVTFVRRSKADDKKPDIK